MKRAKWWWRQPCLLQYFWPLSVVSKSYTEYILVCKRKSWLYTVYSSHPIVIKKNQEFMLNVSLRIIQKLSCITTMEFPVSGAVIYAEQRFPPTMTFLNQHNMGNVWRNVQKYIHFLLSNRHQIIDYELKLNAWPGPTSYLYYKRNWGFLLFFFLGQQNRETA